MQKSIFNKKDWLINHAEYVLELRNKGLPHQQIIQNLKDKFNMPFDIEPSLFSRHLKVILENQAKVPEQTQLADLHQYINYLENSNKDLCEKIKRLRVSSDIKEDPNLVKEIEILKLHKKELIQNLKIQEEQIQNLKLDNSKFREDLVSLKFKNDQLMLKNLEMINFDALQHENIALKRDITRFKVGLDKSSEDLSLTMEKCNTEQMKSGKQSYIILFLIFSNFIFLMLFIISIFFIK